MSRGRGGGRISSETTREEDTGRSDLRARLWTRRSVPVLSDNDTVRFPRPNRPLAWSGLITDSRPPPLPVGQASGPCLLVYTRVLGQRDPTAFVPMRTWRCIAGKSERGLGPISWVYCQRKHTRTMATSTLIPWPRRWVPRYARRAERRPRTCRPTPCRGLLET